MGLIAGPCPALALVAYSVGSEVVVKVVSLQGIGKGALYVREILVPVVTLCSPVVAPIVRVVVSPINGLPAERLEKLGNLMR